MFSQQTELNNATEELVRVELTAGRSTGTNAAGIEQLLRQKQSRVDELQVRVDVTKKAWTNERRRLGLDVPQEESAPIAGTIEPVTPPVLGLRPGDSYAGAAGFLLLLRMVTPVP